LKDSDLILSLPIEEASKGFLHRLISGIRKPNVINPVETKTKILACKKVEIEQKSLRKVKYVNGKFI
jgi:hypothetical protein